MKVTNRWKGLDLIVRVTEELWMKVGNTAPEAVIKKKRSKWQRRKGKINTSEWRVLKNSKER